MRVLALLIRKVSWETKGGEGQRDAHKSILLKVVPFTTRVLTNFTTAFIAS
jgi:hypothetical protein